MWCTCVTHAFLSQSSKTSITIICKYCSKSNEYVKPSIIDSSLSDTLETFTSLCLLKDYKLIENEIIVT